MSKYIVGPFLRTLSCLLVGIIVALSYAGFLQSDIASAKLNQSYRLRNADSSFNFRLRSALLATRWISGDATAIAAKGHKLLVLQYTVENGESRSLDYRTSTIQLVLIGERGKYETTFSPARLLRESDSQMKAGATTDETVWVELPTGENQVELRVSLANGPSLKYDVMNQAKRITGSYVANSGLDAIDEASAKIGAKVPLGAFDVAVTKVEKVTGQMLEGFSPGPGDPFYLVTVSFTNALPTELSLSPNSLLPELLDQQGAQIDWEQTMLGERSNHRMETLLSRGKSAIGRYIFRPKGRQVPTQIRLIDASGSLRSVLVRL